MARGRRELGEKGARLQGWAGALLSGSEQNRIGTAQAEAARSASRPPSRECVEASPLTTFAFGGVQPLAELAPIGAALCAALGVSVAGLAAVTQLHEESTREGSRGGATGHGSVRCVDTAGGAEGADMMHGAGPMQVRPADVALASQATQRRQSRRPASHAPAAQGTAMHAHTNDHKSWTLGDPAAAAARRAVICCVVAWL